MNQAKNANPSNSKLIIFANAAFTITNFRSELIKSLLDTGMEVIVICPEDCDLLIQGNTYQLFKSLGVKFCPINFNRSSMNPFSDLLLLLKLIKVIRREKPDAILNYTIKATIYGSIAAWFCRTRKIASNITGLGYVFTNASFKASVLRYLVKMQYKVSLGVNDIVFFQNNDDLHLFEEEGIVRSKTATKVLNGSGVNLGLFFPNPAISKIPQSFIFVGRLLKDKGVFEFIEAARKIKKDYPNSSFKLVGAADENPAGISKKLLDQSISEDLIEHVMPTSEVLAHLHKSEVFVLPSYREGTPRSVLEAMAAGLPIITTDVPGCRETVSHYVNGILVPEKDVESLCSAMKELLTNADLRLEMGQQSLLRAKKLYDVHKVNAEIINQITC